MEHGWQGRYIEGFELAQQYGLKFVSGVEAYWVKDRFEKDRSNCHIYIGAKNEKGRRAMNDVMAEANITGFYMRPRLDIPLLLSLPADDVIVTTACVAYWKYEDIDDITLRLRDHFGHNFFLEVQYHNMDKQIAVNEHILDLHIKHSIPIIMGCDSHYLFPSDAGERSDYIVSKGIEYPDEQGFVLDYPDGDEAYRRFANQGVLSHSDIIEAMENTNVFLKVEDYDCACFTKDIKMPSLHPDWTQEQKDAAYDNLIWSSWSKEKSNVPQEKWPHYESEIQKEVDIVHQTFHADYFLDDHAIVKKGKENGGVLTKTGRGSAVSFYTNKLLGLTDVDRIAAKVKMYPERFMSATRILETGSIADIDLNVADRDPFLRAQKEIMGEESSYEMIAYGTLKPKAAWKMYAKSQNVDFIVANEISDQISKYENAVKHASEDEKDDINVMDYIDPAYHEIFEQSRNYRGIVSHLTPHPCATLLYQGNIRQEIGLINIKGKICCIMDGLWAEQYHFLKNDWLKATIVDLIDRVYKRIGIPQHSEQELLALCPPDSPVWDMIYGRSCTLGINQVEQIGTSSRVAKYKPHNISELCAFVAAIRPGFKSMYKKFENREHFEYGIKSLDNLIQTEEMHDSFMLYQEMAMAVLHYAGIPMSECYGIIKNIAKKRVQKVLAYKQTFTEGFKKELMANENETEDEAESVAHDVWQILEDSSRYSFNCVAGSTRLRRDASKSGYTPTIEEMFLIKNNPEYAKAQGKLPLHRKYKRLGYGKTLSLFDDGALRYNSIIDIYDMGVKNTLILKTESGKEICCTEDHKIPTPEGIKKAKDFVVGDTVFVCGERNIQNNVYRFTNNKTPSNTPKLGQRGFQKKDFSAINSYNDFRDLHVKNGIACSMCGIPFSASLRFEVHHKDFDRMNNDQSNFMWVCAGCHKKLHYQHGRNKKGSHGYLVNEEKIVSITHSGDQHVYDVEMQHPAHNFTLDNGLVVCNCSHSYCVAEDSLYGAYLKTNYHLEFYETFLRILEEKGDKDRINAVKEEAENYFNVQFPPYRFRQDNRSFSVMEGENAIQNSITAIKGMGKLVGDILYECGQQQHDSFISVLTWLDHHSLKAATVTPLIKIDYFAEFGNSVELLRILEMFDFFKQGNAKTIKREKITDPALQSIIEQHSTWINAKGVELKSYTITDMAGLLLDIESMIKSIGFKDVSISVKMEMQKEILGYVELTTNKEEDRRKLMILSTRALISPRTNEPWAYAVYTKSIGSGKTARLTVRANVMQWTPFKEGNFIYAKQIGKERGYWYLYDYDVIQI